MPVVARTSSPRSLNALAVPYSAAPRSPSTSVARAPRDNGTADGCRSRRESASTQAIGNDGEARSPVATSGIGAPDGVGGRPSAASTPSSRARDNRAPTVANQMLHETANASAGRSG